jgi:hypothetical protein
VNSFLLCAGLVVGGTAVDTVDAYQDAAVRLLVSRAREARSAQAEGFGSFEVTFRERLYAGLKGEIARRERALFHQERAARIHWKENGDRVIRWLGARRGVPILGARVELEEDPATEDLFDAKFEFLDPSSDRIFLGSDWALHPLADTASLHYRYRLGDTLQIRFGGMDRAVTLVEAVVEPRESRFDRIAASLWFDNQTAVLVRAAYRPARPFDLDLDEPEDAEDVPGFLRPIRVAIDFITIDYGFQELRWWLPNRIAFEGAASVGTLLETLARLEWSFENYELGGEETLDPGDALPDTWTRLEREGGGELGDADLDSLRVAAGDTAGVAAVDTARARPKVVVIIPPRDSLLASPELPEPYLGGESIVFDEAEISELKDLLGQVRAPPPPLGPSRFSWLLGPGLLRFNRVEGLSPAARFTFPVAPETRVETEARIGVAEWEPHGEIRLARRTTAGSLGIGVYRRLVDVGDWGRPLGFGNSVNALLLGYDGGMYYRTTGGELFGSRAGRRWRLEGRLFAERHRTARRNTDVTLPNAFGEFSFPDNIAADRVDVIGLAGRVRAYSGASAGGLVLSTTVWGEAAAGDADYGRLAAQGSLTTPLFGRWIGALEVGAGTTFGSPPTQRLYYLGGPYTLRGFVIGDAAGEAFWMARGELGYGFKVAAAEETPVGGAFRLSLFGDLAWAGARDDFGAEEYRAAVGIGLSLLDGLFRIDLAKGVRRGNELWLHLYADGLF